MKRHVVWDWNGTLFSDAEAILAATNDAFAPLGIRPIAAAQYRAAFTRPIRQFYEAIAARSITDAEMTQLDLGFHAAYQRRLVGCALAGDARDALTQLAIDGHSQSLLSLWTHARLLELVAEHRLAGFFARVDGRVGNDQVGKAAPLTRHLASLALRGEQVVLIGDTLDDAVAARAVGADCVLYAGGSHEVARLRETGFPVTDSLLEAVELCSS